MDEKKHPDTTSEVNTTSIIQQDDEKHEEKKEDEEEHKDEEKEAPVPPPPPQDPTPVSSDELPNILSPPPKFISTDHKTKDEADDEVIELERSRLQSHSRHNSPERDPYPDALSLPLNDAELQAKHRICTLYLWIVFLAITLLLVTSFLIFGAIQFTSMTNVLTLCEFTSPTTNSFLDCSQLLEGQVSVELSKVTGRDQTEIRIDHGDRFIQFMTPAQFSFVDSSGELVVLANLTYLKFFLMPQLSQCDSSQSDQSQSPYCVPAHSTNISKIFFGST